MIFESHEHEAIDYLRGFSALLLPGYLLLLNRSLSQKTQKLIYPNLMCMRGIEPVLYTTKPASSLESDVSEPLTILLLQSHTYSIVFLAGAVFLCDLAL